jgi:hypothetical protein
LCLKHVDHRERIASRWRPAFSSHLINSGNRKLEVLGLDLFGNPANRDSAEQFVWMEA